MDCLFIKLSNITGYWTVCLIGKLQWLYECTIINNAGNINSIKYMDRIGYTHDTEQEHVYNKGTMHCLNYEIPVMAY